MYVFDKDNAVKDSYMLAAKVMHIEFRDFDLLNSRPRLGSSITLS